MTARRLAVPVLALTALLVSVYWPLSTPTQVLRASVPDPAVDTKPSAAPGEQVAVLAGGCFWCTEVVFERLAGVKNVVSGYAGGTAETARYDLVSEGKTEHAESIQILFDPARLTYGQLLKVFFAVAHDPTQLNRQGPDYGRQYRSAVFYSNPEQKRIAEMYIRQLGEARVFDKPIVTQVVELKAFYPAEAYHQDFVRRNPNHPYVVANAIPKLHKLRKELPDMLKSDGR